jgi:hypothetical protein
MDTQHSTTRVEKPQRCETTGQAFGFANMPDCLGCALLEMPERCVTWEGGEVRCDECGGANND